MGRFIRQEWHFQAFVRSDGWVVTMCIAVVVVSTGCMGSSLTVALSVMSNEIFLSLMILSNYNSNYYYHSYYYHYRFSNKNLITVKVSVSVYGLDSWSNTAVDQKQPTWHTSWRCCCWWLYSWHYCWRGPWLTSGLWEDAPLHQLYPTLIQRGWACLCSFSFFFFNKKLSPPLLWPISGKSECNILLPTPPQDKSYQVISFISGDFNAHHSEWVGSRYADRHGQSGLKFSTASGCDQWTYSYIR